LFLSLQVPILGGIDRQNRVGSKFGGGGVSSSQQSERERKERLKQLALESIDLAKDPYLMRNHLGTYECKLCLTLHTNEANYLAHTQGKKHQQGLARRAHMEKLRAEKEGTAVLPGSSTIVQPPAQKKVRIGRPAYQVFKSRDADTHQRCLSFELSVPEISEGLQPRHRFMSAFEQRVETPPDRRYQYLLFAAEPYETVAFKIPNEAIDKEPGRFVTHWDAEEKKFTVTLYFVDAENPN
jgi:splicing factor 3A subunit 2